MKTNSWIKRIGSLRLTVGLLAASMLLVFFGTLDQVTIGIHEGQRRYFESLLVTYPQSVHPSGWMGLFYFGGFLPMPGGYLVGALLLMNLTVAHWIHFKRSWKKAGISIMHAGVLLLLVSGFLTSWLQVEGQMSIREGESSHYSFTQMANELVVLDRSHPEHDTEFRIPEALLQAGESYQPEPLPFSIKVLSYFPNADLYPQADEGILKKVPSAFRPQISEGRGVEMNVVIAPRPKSYTQEDVNTATAIIELSDESGSMGTWLVSNIFESNEMPPQAFDYKGKPYAVAMRFERDYKPYRVHLEQVDNDYYPGTEKPRNFSSNVRIENPVTGEGRKALIYMNHPLRHEGETYFQHQMDREATFSIFQVVRNPGWLLPYVAISLVGIGMTYHFLLHLWAYLKRSRNPVKKEAVR